MIKSKNRIYKKQINFDQRYLFINIFLFVDFYSDC